MISNSGRSYINIVNNSISCLNVNWIMMLKILSPRKEDRTSNYYYIRNTKKDPTDISFHCFLRETQP